MSDNMRPLLAQPGTGCRKGIPMDWIQKAFMRPILAWHWLPEDRVPAHGRRRKPLKVGSVMRITGQPVVCQRGLHASRHILDALRYAQGPVVCRVALSGTVIERDDKLVGTRRRILAMADAGAVLHEAACDWAEEALRRANVLDERPWSALEAKRRWLRGEASDEEVDTANSAAGQALQKSAWDATEVAAGAAAVEATAVDNVWGAAWDTAWVAARTATLAATARDNVWGTAWVAAWVAAKSTAPAATQAAPHAPCWNAAWDHAWAQINDDLERRVMAMLRWP